MKRGRGRPGERFAAGGACSRREACSEGAVEAPAAAKRCGWGDSASGRGHVSTGSLSLGRLTAPDRRSVAVPAVCQQSGCPSGVGRPTGPHRLAAARDGSRSLRERVGSRSRSDIHHSDEADRLSDPSGSTRHASGMFASVRLQGALGRIPATENRVGRPIDWSDHRCASQTACFEAGRPKKRCTVPIRNASPPQRPIRPS